MTNSPSTFHPRPIVNEPPRKRAKSGHDGCSYLIRDTLPKVSLPPAVMAQSTATLNTYIPHTSLETISNKIKKLQSDLSEAANGQCFGPGKQKVLDCKHDVDVLAGMVKGLDVHSAARKKSLDMLVEASIDQLFDKHVGKAKKAVDGDTKQLIREMLCSTADEKVAKAAIKEGLNNESDVLLNFEAKFRQHFREVLADAVASLMAERHRQIVLEQLMKT
ncbi:hypothetical protein KCU81_g9877, partial [Aureobasidium melanogenum]|uniref:Uncharacterized protein n=1 Tax=Aureobasidium melanogenum (strain CBS 110374) TaxID=1043003 RepID=A0A074VJC0_AURM1